MRDDGTEEVGAQVNDGTHEQAAGAAALDGDAARLAVAVAGEVFDGCDEVGEGVPLLHQAAGIVPRLAHVAAAADVRVGEDDTTIKQAEAVAVESDRQ
jgi:hypothetical protein